MSSHPLMIFHQVGSLMEQQEFAKHQAKTSSSFKPDAFAPKILKLPAVRDETKQHVDSIFAYRERLICLLSLYGETIFKRWQKKGIDQRKKVLLTAWPNMPESYRPDIRNCYIFEGPDKMPDECKENFVWPHINLEDLSKATPLPHMMQFRAKYPPEDYVSFDFNSMSLGVNSRALMPGYLKGWTTVFLGRRTTKTYGQLRSWAQHPESRELNDLGIGLQPGEGILVLRLQVSIYRFLCHCIELVVPDLPLPEVSDASDEAITRLLACVDLSEQNLLTTDPEESSLLAAHFPPPRFDIKRMARLLYAKHMEVEDHLWYVREDPAYFHDGLLDYSEHQLEQLPDTKGQRHPGLHSQAFWTQQVFTFTVSACGDCFLWGLLGHRLTQVIECYTRHGDQADPGKRLPHDLEVALCRFTYHLSRTIHHDSVMLSTARAASPPLRKYYLRDADDDINDPEYPQKPFVDRLKKRSMLLWLLEQLENKEAINVFGLHNLLGYTNRIMVKSQKARELISPYLAKMLSEMDLINQILRYFLIFRFKLPVTDIVSTTELKSEYAERTFDLNECFLALDPEKAASHFIFGLKDPLQMFACPSDDSELTPKTVNMRRLAEEKLDKFFGKIDQTVRKKTGKGIIPNLAPNLSGRKLRRTIMWTEPAIRKNSWRQDAESSGPPASPTPPLPDTTTPEHPPIVVGKKAFKTFIALFASSTPHAPRSTILWSEFINAMINAGFKAEKLAGSGWVFWMKDDTNPSRAILFHEPHPGTEMPLEMVRRYGERLGRAYGFTGKTFVRAEQAKPADVDEEDGGVVC